MDQDDTLGADTPRMEIEDSFAAIETASGKRFSERFYENLFDSYPELKERFSGVIMAHQGALLTSALGIIAGMYRTRRPSIDEYLKVLGHRHFQRGISKEDYTKFEHALLATLASFHGTDWSPQLQEQWQVGINSAVETMLQGHRAGQVIY